MILTNKIGIVMGKSMTMSAVHRWIEYERNLGIKVTPGYWKGYLVKWRKRV